MADNPQAFPCLDNDGYTLSMRDPGMTLLDYFAGQALAGYFAAPHTPHMNADPAGTAQYCYQMAAAMLNERQSQANKDTNHDR